MPSFFFWNVKNENAVRQLGGIVATRDIDVLMLTECPVDVGTILRTINGHGPNIFHFAPPIMRTRPLVFVKYSSDFVVPLFDSEHLTIRRLQFPAKSEILLAVLHLPSPLHFDEGDRSKKAAEVCQMIADCERTVGHDRTVVVGDFNMDPFSDGLISASAFNAVAVRSIAERRTRTVSFAEYSMFFNPMWSMFSDGTKSSPGTYFRNPTGYQSLYHRIFDQVLIRPSIMSWLKAENLTLVDIHGTISLSDEKKVPSVSDHLPLSFVLDY